MIIALIDTETTGLRGHPQDVVVDIGVSLIDTQKGTVTPAYSAVVGYDTDKWREDRKQAWIFTNKDATLTVEEVKNAKPAEEIAKELRAVIGDYPITSFNQVFDFDRFLYWPPWNLRVCKHAPDVMTEADRIEEIPRRSRDPYTGWRSFPTLAATYAYLCPEDPAHINGKQDHRALSDTIVAGYVMLELIKRDKYEREPELYGGQ